MASEGGQRRASEMHMFGTFVAWLRRSSDKSEKLEFKSHRKATEFARRIYNESGKPNAKLRAAYKQGRSMVREAA